MSDLNAGVWLGTIGDRLAATSDAWAADGYPTEGPLHDAREAAFAELRAWNKANAAPY